MLRLNKCCHNMFIDPALNLLYRYRIDIVWEVILNIQLAALFVTIIGTLRLSSEIILFTG